MEIILYLCSSKDEGAYPQPGLTPNPSPKGEGN